MVTIESLQPGQRFKIGKQRKFMTFKKSKRLQGEYVLSEHQGKILVILDNCRQIICEPNQEVELEHNH